MIIIKLVNNNIILQIMKNNIQHSHIHNGDNNNHDIHRHADAPYLGHADTPYLGFTARPMLD